MSAVNTLEEVEMQIAADLTEKADRKYKDYRPKHQYAVMILRATNQRSQFNQMQVILDIAAVTDAGEPATKTNRLWLDYPVTPEGVEPRRQHLLRARDIMAQILRAQSEDYNAYGLIEKAGYKSHYYDLGGNLLDNEGIKSANEASLTKIIAELNLRLKDAARWEGPAGYATFAEYIRMSGKLARNFQNFRFTPDPEFPLLTDPSEFFAIL